MRKILTLLLVALAGCATPPADPTAAVVAPTAAPPTIAPPSPTIAPPSPTTAPPTVTAPPSPTTTPPSPTPAPRYDLVLVGATLIDGTGAAPMPAAAVAILGGRIAAVGRAGELPFTPDTPVRELAGATLMPGFINAHAHITGLDDEGLRAWPRAGVTTIRDLGGPLAEVVARRDRITASTDPGLPRLIVAGPIVNVLGSFSTEISGVNDRVLIVDGPDDARARVTALLDGGADLVKLAVSGRTDVSYAELSDQEVAAIAEVARARGAHVAAHVDPAVALRLAVLSGGSSVAHSPRDRVPDDLIALMVERGVELVPTIAVYEGLAAQRGNLAEWRRSTRPVMYDNLRRFAAAGGTLALGDDYGGAPGQTVGMPMDEINHWLAAGLTPLQVITAATGGGASVLERADELGRVAPGYIADILVVAGDPLADITALTRPLLVLRDGREVVP